MIEVPGDQPLAEDGTGVQEVGPEGGFWAPRSGHLGASMDVERALPGPPRDGVNAYGNEELQEPGATWTDRPLTPDTHRVEHTVTGGLLPSQAEVRQAVHLHLQWLEVPGPASIRAERPGDLLGFDAGLG